MTLKETGSSPLVVDIKRHSLEDGPGCRSVVFFKGCPLRCIFCHSPETQDPQFEIAFSPGDCIGCGACGDACPEHAIDLDLPGRIRREACNRCGECASVCPGKGLRLIGTYYTPEDLAGILLKDIAYYRHSGGGVTLSGGEATLYPEYLGNLLPILKRSDVHVTLETSGYFDPAVFRSRILPHIDLIYYDIKLIDPDDHRKYTGKSNRLILDNFRLLMDERATQIHPRVPLVPGITATRENLSRVVDFLCDVGAKTVSLLPYNPMGIGMAASLGRRTPPLPEHFMSPEEEREIHQMFSSLINVSQQ